MRRPKPCQCQRCKGERDEASALLRYKAAHLSPGDQAAMDQVEAEALEHAVKRRVTNFLQVVSWLTARP